MAYDAPGAAEQRLQDAVLWQLARDPEADASTVSVSAHNDVVRLRGYVESYAARVAAERAARRAAVRARVVSELELKPALARTDREIADQAIAALKNRIDVPRGVSATVRAGVVLLTGTVTHAAQKAAAERTVMYLPGVRDVSNQIRVAGGVSPRHLERCVVAALRRCADPDEPQIHVEAHGPCVTLSGRVRSWIQKEQAERAAWSVPDVVFIDSRIVVAPER